MKLPLISAYQNYCKVFRPGSALRFAVQRRLGVTAAKSFQIKSADPGLVYLRPASSDYLTLKEIFLKQEYAFAAMRLGETPLVVDVGANIGLASRYFLHHRPGARILAVEALPDTYGVAQKNLGLASIADRCRVINAAVWSNNDTISIGVPDSGAFSRAAVGSSGDITVRATRLDTLFEQEKIDHVDLLKVDIEGAEVEMFRNVDDWLSKVGALAIEFHDDSRQECRFDEAMASHGFKIDQASDHTVYAARS